MLRADVYLLDSIIVKLLLPALVRVIGFLWLVVIIVIIVTKYVWTALLQLLLFIYGHCLVILLLCINSIAAGQQFIRRAERVLCILHRWDKNFASSEHIRLVHLTFCVFLCDFFLELRQFFLNGRVDISRLFQWATCQCNLVPIWKNASVDYIWINTMMRLYWLNESKAVRFQNIWIHGYHFYSMKSDNWNFEKAHLPLQDHQADFLISFQSTVVSEAVCCCLLFHALPRAMFKPYGKGRPLSPNYCGMAMVKKRFSHLDHRLHWLQC